MPLERRNSRPHSDSHSHWWWQHTARTIPRNLGGRCSVSTSEFRRHRRAKSVPTPHRCFPYNTKELELRMSSTRLMLRSFRSIRIRANSPPSSSRFFFSMLSNFSRWLPRSISSIFGVCLLRFFVSLLSSLSPGWFWWWWRDCSYQYERRPRPAPSSTRQHREPFLS